MLYSVADINLLQYILRNAALPYYQRKRNMSCLHASCLQPLGFALLPICASKITGLENLSGNRNIIDKLKLM